jgi:hypothetical protein
MESNVLDNSRRQSKYPPVPQSERHNMDPQPRPVLFYSIDGVSTHGPVSEEDLRQFHLEGSLLDSALYAEPDFSRNYERWLPIARLVRRPELLGSIPHAPQNLAALLHVFSGWFVGLNLNSATAFEVVRLASVGGDFFTVEPRGTGSIYHFPFTRVISVTETSSFIETKIQKPTPPGDTATWIREGGGVGGAKRLQEWIRAKIEVLLLIQVDHVSRGKGTTETVFGT